MDLTAAKGRYHGCLNSIMSICGKQRNEITTLHLVKTYCLPRLLYACEVMPFSSVQTRELHVMWNSAFRPIFNCYWGGSVKPLQYFCTSLPLTWLLDERKLLFYRKATVHSNTVLRTLMSTVYSKYVSLCDKYNINKPYCSIRCIKQSVWNAFAKSVAL